MARKMTPTLTEAELKLMDVVWKLGEATVNDVLDALPKEQSPAYNTVLTILRILEQKQYLGHKKSGRAHVYRPIVNRDQARQTAVRDMVSRFFNNSPEALMVNILSDEKISATELKRLNKMIDNSSK